MEIRFFSKEELDISKYKLREKISNVEKENFLSPNGEGRGPWIPFPSILMKLKRKS